MNKNKKPIVVYWAPEALLEKEHQQILLELPFIPVMKYLQKNRKKEILPKRSIEDPNSNGYHMCPALHELTENLFYIKAPFSVNLSINEDGSINNSNYSTWFQQRNTSIENGKSLDFDFSYMLFCEEELNVSITPPYLHQTSQPEYGFICSVKWDISSWFRPHNLIYQLWPNKNNLYFERDEPLAYLKFETERPVIFKEYKLTPEILNIASACLKHKYIIGLEPMEKLYKKFTQTSMKKRLILEIKKNLIE